MYTDTTNVEVGQTVFMQRYRYGEHQYKMAIATKKTAKGQLTTRVESRTTEWLIIFRQDGSTLREKINGNDYKTGKYNSWTLISEDQFNEGVARKNELRRKCGIANNMKEVVEEIRSQSKGEWMSDEWKEDMLAQINQLKELVESV